MKRNRLMAILLAGCMVIGNNPVLLQAAEQEELLYVDEEEVILTDEDEDAASVYALSENKTIVDEAMVNEAAAEEVIVDEADTAVEDSIEVDDIIEGPVILDAGVYAEADTDTIPPVIDFDSLSVSISGGKEKATVGDTVTLAVNVTDDRGVENVQWRLHSPVTGTNPYIPCTYVGTDSETKNGRWEATFTVTEETENGIWKSFYIMANDKNGYTERYNKELSIGSTVADLSACDFEVEGTSADPDIIPPVIDFDSLSVSISGGKEKATAGDTVTLAVNVTDDRGVENVQWRLHSPVTGDNPYIPCTYVGTDSKTKNGRWEATFTVTEETENGIWKSFYIMANDKNGYTERYNEDLFPISTEDMSACNFEVEGTASDPDIIPPVIDFESLTISISDGKEKATAGDTVTLAVNVTDDQGVENVQWRLHSPVTGTNPYIPCTYVGTDSETKNGRWEATFTVTDETETGIWKSFYIMANDKNGYTERYNKELSIGSTVADLSACDFEVTSPDCPLDLTTSGYSIMLDGAGSTTTFGGNYYVNSADETITPDTKVRFEDESGWTTLAPRKYTLKYEKKTGANSWEDYTADTFGVDETGTVTYRVSATGKESLYYTGTIGPVEFNVIRKYKVTFVSSYDNSVIETVRVISGEAVDAIEAPVIYDSGEGGDGKPFAFYGWGTDPDPVKYNVAQAGLYDFSSPVNQDMTLYAIYKTSISFIAAAGGSVSSGVWGGSYSGEANNFHYLGDHNHDTYAYAKADEGVRFLGWRIGSPHGEDAAEKGIPNVIDTDWNNDTVNIICVAGDHNYTFYAVFGHEVTFDSRGGSPVDTQYVIKGEKALVPSEPTREDYFFDGWFADEDLTEPFDFDAAIDCETIAYAKWTAAVKISIGVYDLTNSVCGQGGTYTFNDEDMTHTVDKHAAKYGTIVNVDTAPDEGYVFRGWYIGRIAGETDGLVIEPAGDPLIFEPAWQVGAVENLVLCAAFRESSDTPPEVDVSTLQIQVPENRKNDRVITTGDRITVSVRITDNGTVKKAKAYFSQYNDSESEETFQTVDLTSQGDDLWSGEFEIKDNTERGLWEFMYVSAEDDNKNEAGWYNSAYYEDQYSPCFDLSAFNFTVKDNYTVTFESNGGSEVPPQTVIEGQRATEPEDPVRDGWDFGYWYADEALKNEFWFSTPISGDITLYGLWNTGMAISVYNQSNPNNYNCGTVDIETAVSGYGFSDTKTMNFTVPEGSVKFIAKPEEGYVFKGWYRGVIGSSSYVETPSDELLSAETEYTCAAGEEAICAVFECAGHRWEQKVRKATPDADGHIYQKCSVCGTEEMVASLLKVSNIKLEGTSYAYTGKAIEPKVIVANASETLAQDQYTVEYSNNVNAGTANVKVTLKGDYYEGSTNLTFTITKPEDSGNNNPSSGGPAPTSETTGKMANPMTVKGKTVTLRYSKLQKKAQGIKSAKAITISDAKGKITYKLAGVTKKKFRKFFKVNAQTGKITVKKGLQKGIYKVKVKIKAEGDNDYLASDEKTVIIKVKVK